MELHGETANQTSLFGWNTDQAKDNYGELSEIHRPDDRRLYGRLADGRFRRGRVPHRAGRSRDRGDADVRFFAASPRSTPCADAGAGASDGGSAANERRPCRGRRFAGRA